MPVYTYQCSQCRNSFEVRKRMSDLDSETRCPDCGSAETERLIANVAIFATGSDGQRRALAGMPSCGGCSMAGTGCTSCGPR
jgi:putative FmdB family regulatory protein